MAKERSLYPSMLAVRKRMKYKETEDDKQVLGRLRKASKRNSRMSSAQPPYTCEACGYIHN